MFVLYNLIFARFPTYKYFVIPDGYSEIEIHDPDAQSAFEFGRDTVQKCLADFYGPHPITLLHAWKKAQDGEYFALEVYRLRVKYLITVHKTEEGKHYLHSVRIMNEETESGAHWFHPPEDVLDLCIAAAREQFGQDLNFRNVAVYRTVMAGKTTGQMLVDVETSNERMLISINLLKLFGERQFKITEIQRIY